MTAEQSNTRVRRRDKYPVLGFLLSPASRSVIMILTLLILGSIFFGYNEDLSVTDAVYLTVVTTTTVGYGDIPLEKESTRIVAVFYVILGIGCFAYAIGVVTDAVMKENEGRMLRMLNRLDTSPQAEDSGMSPVLKRGIISTIMLVVVFAIGMVFYVEEEDISTADALYFCAMSLTTVGFGDFSASTDTSKWFTVFYLLFGLACASFAISSLMETLNAVLAKTRESSKAALVSAASRAQTDKIRINALRRSADRRKSLGLDAIDVDQASNDEETASIKQEADETFQNTLRRDLLALAAPVTALLLNIIITALAMGYLEDWGALKSIYFTVTMLTTVGYGEVTPTREVSRGLCVLFVIVGISMFVSSITVVTDILVASHEKKLVAYLDRQERVSPGFMTPGRWRMVVALTFIAVFFFIGMIYYHEEDGLGSSNVFYFVGITLSTVGYGDITPSTDDSRRFTIFFHLVGLMVVGFAVQSLVSIFMEDADRRLREKMEALLLENEQQAELAAQNEAIPDYDEYLSQLRTKQAQRTHTTGRCSRAEMEAMDTNQVVHWMRAIGLAGSPCDATVANDITGRSLLRSERSNLETCYGPNVGLRVFAEMELLKEEDAHPVDVYPTSAATPIQGRDAVARELPTTELARDWLVSLGASSHALDVVSEHGLTGEDFARSRRDRLERAFGVADADLVWQALEAQ